MALWGIREELAFDFEDLALPTEVARQSRPPTPRTEVVHRSGPPKPFAEVDSGELGTI